MIIEKELNFQIHLLVGTGEIIIMQLCNHANMHLCDYAIKQYEIEFQD